MISLKSLPHLCSWPLDLLIHLFMPEISLRWCNLMSFARDCVAERQRNKDKWLGRFVIQNCVFKKKKKRINKGKCEHLKHIIPALLIYCRNPLFIEYFTGIWLYGSWWGNGRILILTAKIFAVNVMTCLVYNVILSRWLFFKFHKMEKYALSLHKNDAFLLCLFLIFAY